MQEHQPNPNPNPKTTPTESSTTKNNEAEEQQLACPRCGSKQTKFCYYNNYKLTQPRHYCKSCRRYWTNGGMLRNIPIGGGSRKNLSKCATSSKKFSVRQPASPSTSASVMEMPVGNEMAMVPVQNEIAMVQNKVFCEQEGYYGNFNMGWPCVRSYGESGSNYGGSERVFNGDLNLFYRDL